MPKDSDTIEQAVSRTVRDSLERLQRAADELHHAVADIISACSSRKPANVLPPMLRAQTAAAALAASLDVLVRFISTALQPVPRPLRESEAEAETLRVVSIPAPEPSLPPAMPPRSIPVPMSQPPEPAPKMASADAAEQTSVEPRTVQTMDTPGAVEQASLPVAETSPPIPSAPPAERGDTSLGDPAFQITDLPIEEQELHRRANRVAKVSMQDIKMLRPDQVRVGQENRDICIRLRDEIEKAHREYDRRFRPILGHPVDYFYYWMVQILGGGDPESLGEYPYRSPIVRR